jgi:hypothetical protein
MGRALEPGIRQPFCLDYDKGKPTGERPTFYAPAMSLRQQIEWANKYDQFVETRHENPQSVLDAMLDLLSCFVDWENVKVDGKAIPFALQSFPDVVDRQEAMELIGKVIYGDDPTPDEKKS